MIAATIALEGGYVNHPADPGGETNMGITKKVAVNKGYVGPMRTLPREVAESIYYEDYIVAPGFEPLIAMNAPVVEELYDTASNMGPRARRASFSSRSTNYAERGSYRTARLDRERLPRSPHASKSKGRRQCAFPC
jgi:lysozyme family protein